MHLSSYDYVVWVTQKSFLCSYTRAYKKKCTHLIVRFALATTVSNVRIIGGLKGKNTATWFEHRRVPTRSRQSVSRIKAISFQAQVLLVY